MLGRIFRALLSSAFAQLCALVLNVALVPAYLTHWSTRMYGEWLALSSAVVYLGALDAGMQMAAVNRLTQAYARNDLDDYRRMQHTALVFYIAVGLLGAIVVLLCATVFPVRELLGIQEMPERDVRLCLVYLGLQIVLSIPLGLIGGTYKTIGKIATGQWISNCKQVTTAVVILFALAAGKGPAAVALAQLMISVAVVVGVAIDISYRFPNIRPGLQLASWKYFKELVRPSALFALIMGGNALAIQGPPIVISSCLGGFAVAEFVTCRSLISYGKQITSMLSNSVLTDLTRIDAIGRTDQLRTLQRIFVGVTCAISVAFSAFLIVDGSRIVQVWSARKVPGNQWLITGLCLAALLQTVWQTVSLVCISSNRHFRVSTCTAISSVLGIALIAVTLRHFGLLAVPLAMILSEGVVCYHFVVADACRAMNLAYGRFAGRLWSATVAACILAVGISKLLVAEFPGSHLQDFLLVAICAGVVAVIIMWFTFVPSSDRAFATARVLAAMRLTSANEPA